MKDVQNRLAMLGLLASLVSSNTVIGSEERFSITVPEMLGYYDAIQDISLRQKLLKLTQNVNDYIKLMHWTPQLGEMIRSHMTRRMDPMAAKFLANLLAISTPEKMNKYKNVVTEILQGMKAKQQAYMLGDVEAKKELKALLAIALAQGSSLDTIIDQLIVLESRTQSGDQKNTIKSFVNKLFEVKSAIDSMQAADQIIKKVLQEIRQADETELEIIIKKAAKLD